MAFTLNGPAFRNGGAIPAKYTAEGENLSPPLAWSDVPAGTCSFAPVVEDPDAHVVEPWERARPHMLAEAELVGTYQG